MVDQSNTEGENKILSAESVRAKYHQVNNLLVDTHRTIKGGNFYHIAGNLIVVATMKLDYLAEMTQEQLRKNYNLLEILGDFVQFTRDYEEFREAELTYKGYCPDLPKSHGTLEHLLRYRLSHEDLQFIQEMGAHEFYALRAVERHKIRMNLKQRGEGFT